MARKFTAKQALNMSTEDMSMLSTEDMRELVKQLNKIKKDRVREFRKQGLSSPAFGKLEQGLLDEMLTTSSVRNIPNTSQGRDVMYHLSVKLQKTLTSQTSTIRGEKKFLDNLRHSAKNYGVADTKSLSYEQLDMLARAMGELKETPELYGAVSLNSGRAFSSITKIMVETPSTSFDDFMGKIWSAFQNIQQDEVYEETDFSDWVSSSDNNPFL